MIRGFFIALALAISSLAYAAPEPSLVLDLRFKPGSPEVPTEAPVSISLRRVVGSAQETRETEGVVPSTVELAVGSGSWLIEVRGVGILDNARVVSVPGGSPVRVTIEVWKTVLVRGEIVTPPNQVVPTLIETRWRGVDNNGPAEGLARCELDENDFTCSVPAARVDLRIRARGYVTHFFPEVDLTSESARGVGKLDLKRGASVVGMVQAGKGVSVQLDKVAVRMRQLGGGGGGEKPVTGKPDVRGFFHLVGMEPGDYALDARYNELGSETLQLTVRENAETELAAPIRLDRAHTLSVTVDPPGAPETDGRWFGRLYRKTQFTDESEIPAEQRADRMGRFNWRGLLPGSYWMTISSGGRSVLLTQDVEIEERDVALTVTIHQTQVKGRIQLGKRPLAATLWIGGRNHVPTVEVASTSEGTFEATVPFGAEDEWPIGIESKSPRVSRNLRLRPTRDESGAYSLNIDLPGSLIQGRVIDEQGKAVDRGVVSVTARDQAEGLLQALIDRSSGTFELAGLAPGAYEIQATALAKGESEQQVIKVSEDEPLDIELVVRSRLKVAGKVVSDSGDVPNALVRLIPTDRPSMLLEDAHTDSEGIFRISLPSGTRGVDVQIVAAGFPIKMLSVPAAENGLTFRLDRQGGELVIDGPVFSDHPAALHPFLIHRGGIFPVRGLLDVQGVRTERSTRGTQFVQSVVPLVDAGDYQVCLASIAELPSLRFGRMPLERCSSAGYLAPFGSLRLELTPPNESAH